MIDNFKPVSRRAGSRTYTKIGPMPTQGQEGLKESEFKPPEEIAAEQPALEPPIEPPKKKGKFSLRDLTKIRHPSKKQWIIIAIVLVLLIAGGAAIWYKFIKKPIPSGMATQTYKPKPPKPTTEPSRLTGVVIPIELNQLPITGVMIENSPDARPQSGLKDAGVVFEAVAEGGITRFLALYLEGQPEYIGPVRSVRPYYLDWILPFEGSLAHVGGSPDALSQIKALGVRDLDQFFNAGAYSRVSNRYAPHNMYTSMARLHELEKKKGFFTSTFTSFTRKKEAPSATPTARAVDLNISGVLYNPHYDYDPTTNSYKRFLASKPQVDERSGAQMTPKVVIALVMSKSVASDRVHTVYGTTGSGTMFVFQDGLVTQGTWSKADRKAQFAFTDAAGKPLALNPGQTWISIVGEAGSVTYKP